MLLVLNPGRKRRSRKSRGKRRNPSYSYNRRRRHGRSHRSGLFSYNPATTAGKITSGFSSKTLKGVLPIAVGVFGNRWLAPKIQSYLPAGWDTGIKGSITGTLSAGVLAMLAGAVNKKYAAPVLLGGVAQVVIASVDHYMAGSSVAALPAPVPTTVKGLGYGWDPSFAGDGTALDGMDELADDFNDDSGF